MAKRSTSSLLDFPSPQLGTRRSNRDTFGETVAKWHVTINGQQMLPWQRHVVDVAGEINPRTGLRRYDTILLELPRQQGKSYLIEAQMLAASRRPDPTGRPTRRTVLYTAQNEPMARRRITELGDTKLAHSPITARRYVLRRSNGGAAITWRDTRSEILGLPSGPSAGHGLTVDDAFIDEAFDHRDLRVVTGFQPAMITRPDPQLWIVSTPGEGDDQVLLHYEEIAAAAVNDPDSTVAVFLWRADEDDDRADPDVWWRVMPAMGHTIDEAKVRGLLATTAPAEFDRSYLARRPTVATVAALDPAAWADCANRGAQLNPSGPIVLAVDVNPTRTHGNLAVAFGHELGAAAIVDRRPGTGWIVDLVLELVHRPGITVYDVWADRRAGVGGIIDQLQGRGVPVHEVSAGDVASACGDMYDLTVGRQFVHDNQVELDIAVAGSRSRPLGEAWAYDKLRSTADVAPLNAVTLAVAGYRHHFPVPASSAGIR